VRRYLEAICNNISYIICVTTKLRTDFLEDSIMSFNSFSKRAQSVDILFMTLIKIVGRWGIKLTTIPVGRIMI